MPQDHILTKAELQTAFAKLPGWEVRDGWLRRKYGTSCWPTWGVLLGIALLMSPLVGCGQNVATLSDEQLQVQLDEAERQWKVTGAQVTESDAQYITDPKIQAAHKKLKTLQTEHDARAKARR